MNEPKRIVILGSTGSIGENALRVVDECPGLFRVTGLAAGTNAARVAEQAARHGAGRVALADPGAAAAAAA
ncbi:MAG: 1-deoxy-D-xylulose-5-phosphate reductoisomerase, partial [Kiritimatiellae bacterium]|nr:1-deoxy-D-xylulose-5-phosphate reductoisomerase [Kiritimatiellia bacterium]